MNAPQASHFNLLTVAGAALCCALILCGCAHTPPGGQREVCSGPEELIQTEREFCALARERGVAEAFRTFAAEDGMLLPMGENPIKGTAAIFAAMSEGATYELEWAPEAADVAKSGDLGYTWGKSVVRRTGEDGKPIVRHGKYLTVWRRQTGGSWRFVMDIGNPSPAP